MKVNPKKKIDTKIEEFNDLDNLNKQLTNSSKELKIYIMNIEKSLNEEKEKNYKIQTKLDKNTKELKEINDYYKKLKTNNDNLIEQYQSKLDEITNEKNNLISQNKELLEKLKSKSENEEQGLSLDEMIKEDENNNSNNNNNKNKEQLDFYDKIIKAKKYQNHSSPLKEFF